MKNLFNSVKLQRPGKNVFDLVHDVKLSCNLGELIPFCLMDCIPGDKFTIGCKALVRFAPLVAPVMHLFNVYCHYFFIPKRIIWNLYEKWITSGTDVTRPVMPYLLVDSTNHGAPGDLLDYLGVPPELIGGLPNMKISLLPAAAYQMVYNEYYRDENLVTELYPQGDSPLEDLVGDQSADISTVWNVLRKRAWEHDYFTSALPFAQKGGSVSIPIGDLSDVPVKLDVANFGATTVDATPVDFVIQPAVKDGVFGDDLFAQTSTAVLTSTTINDLRRAYALQRWLERNALGGTRFIEFNRAQYGVNSSDKRLQRPEYITGTKSPVVVSEVLNTAGTFDPANPTDPASPPQGNMSGHGVSVTSGNYARYFCEEQGFIMGILSVLPRSAYMQGTERLWFKYDDPVQEYFDSFAHIGEQEVLNKELFSYLPHGTTVTDDNGTFGYNPRYSEYKFVSSRVAGDFRTSLRHWHDARHFANQPQLNQTFIEVDEFTDELNRIFAVTDPDVDKLYIQVLNDIKAVRGMPKYGTPI